MKTQIKYVMLNQFCPVVFSGPVRHKDVKTMLEHSDEEMLRTGEITSAALLCFDQDGRVVVYGESLSLKMGPGPHDAEMLQKFFDGGKLETV